MRVISRVKNRLKSDKGSAEVIEMAFVLPVVMGVVLSIMYLILGVFFYVNSYSISECAMDEISDMSGRNGIYCNLSGKYISDDDKTAIQEKYEERIRKICVLPGMNAKFSYSVSKALGDLSAGPVIRTKISCFYYKKRIFTVIGKRKLFDPAEHTENKEIFLELREKSGGLKRICDEIFREN